MKVNTARYGDHHLFIKGKRHGEFSQRKKKKIGFGHSKDPCPGRNIS